MSRFVSILILGLLVISVQTGMRAGWVVAKAGLAQVLLHYAWEHSVLLGRTVKPWPWMDTYPVARLVVKHTGAKHIVLQGTSGEAMAFGPARMQLPVPSNSAVTENSHLEIPPGLIAIGGHRDTHLGFLEHLPLGEVVSLQHKNGKLTDYILESVTIVDVDSEELHIDTSADGLLLITCYPFDALVAGGPLRAVAFASPAPKNRSTE